MFKNAFEQVLKESHLLPTAAEVQRIYDDCLEQTDDLDEAISETEVLLNIRGLVINGQGRVSAYRNH